MGLPAEPAAPARLRRGLSWSVAPCCRSRKRRPPGSACSRSCAVTASTRARCASSARYWSAEAVAAFRGRYTRDFLETDQPLPRCSLAEGAAPSGASMGEATGPLPFSPQYDYGGAPAHAARDAHPASCARSIAPSSGCGRLGGRDRRPHRPAFPDVTANVRAAVVARYLAQNTWATGSDPRAARRRVPAADPARRRLHPAPPPLRGSDRYLDRAGRRQCGGSSGGQEHRQRHRPRRPQDHQPGPGEAQHPGLGQQEQGQVRPPAMATMADHVGGVAHRAAVSSPSRKTPSSEPKVTPAILKASHEIWSKNENAQASTPSTHAEDRAPRSRDTRR